MQYNETIIKVGIISEYDGFTGKILTLEKEYIFLDSDIVNKGENIQIGDCVKFRAEERAYFVEKLGKKLIKK